MQDDFQFCDRDANYAQLRTAYPNEYECVNDSECVCIPIAGKPGTEFLTPEDISQRLIPGAKVIRRPCLKSA